MENRDILKFTEFKSLSRNRTRYVKGLFYYALSIAYIGYNYNTLYNAILGISSSLICSSIEIGRNHVMLIQTHPYSPRLLHTHTHTYTDGLHTSVGLCNFQSEFIRLTCLCLYVCVFVYTVPFGASPFPWLLWLIHFLSRWLNTKIVWLYLRACN